MADYCIGIDRLGDNNAKVYLVKLEETRLVPFALNKNSLDFYLKFSTDDPIEKINQDLEDETDYSLLAADCDGFMIKILPEEAISSIRTFFRDYV